ASRNNQSFRWGSEDYTCAHRAVLSLASRIAHLVSEAMSPGVIRIPALPETNEEEKWKAAYVEQAQDCGLLDAQRQAGEQWIAFCERYRQQADQVVWDHKSADALQTALLLEANAAAPLVSPQLENPAVGENEKHGPPPPLPCRTTVLELIRIAAETCPETLPWPYPRPTPP